MYMQASCILEQVGVLIAASGLQWMILKGRKLDRLLPQKVQMKATAEA
jgi:hypothetical protein